MARKMKELYSFKLKSHFNKLLFDHLKNVGKMCKEIIMSKSMNFSDSDQMSKVAYLIGISHDFGKSTTFFQNKLNKDERTENAQHSFISSLFGYFLTKKLCGEGRFPLYAWIVISRHHGDIQNLYGEEIKRLKNYQEIVKKQAVDIKRNFLNEISVIYDILLNEIKIKGGASIVVEFFEKIENNYADFIKEIRDSVLRLVSEENLNNYFMIIFLYSVLLDADKLDSCGYSEIPKISEAENMLLTSKLVEEYIENKKFTKNTINELRRKAFNEVMKNLEKTDLDERILSINLPTGLGKTLIGLFAALRLREKIKCKLNFYPKIIYSLPFLSIIDQNSEVIRDILHQKFKEIPSRVFLQHHHLSDISYIENRDDEFESLDPSKALILVEGWHSEIIITTFIQLFHSMITNKSNAARKFHNIINSILILDEVQNIPVKYWKMLSIVLETLCTKFNCWVILMSATQPLIFSSEKVKSLVDNEQLYFNAVDRYDVIFKGAMSMEEFKEHLKKEIEGSDKDLLIILNTINSCKDIYAFVKSIIREKYGNEEISSEGYVKFGFGSKKPLILINLSTLIIPVHRLERIKVIRENKNVRKIIVTTQLIEAGVDISASRVIRDFAPIDSIIQSAGRCNRNFDQEKGQIMIVGLRDDRGKYLSSYIYDSTLLGASKECIEETFKSESVSEKEFSLKIQKNYYNIISNRTAQAEDEMKHIKALNFSRISEFKLIENEPNVDILVDIDGTISKNLEKIKKLIEDLKEKGEKKNKFEILAEVEKEKRKLAKYIVSIPFYKLKDEILNLPEALGSSKTFRKVNREFIKEFYDIESGFRINEKTETNLI
jgi:CRISPR-associated endonuclease/helicase Cas3